MEYDLQIFTMTRDQNGGGVVSSENCGYSGMSRIEVPSNGNLEIDTVAVEVLEAAELAAQEIICRIHPTVVDNRKRKQVIEYVHGLIGHSLGCQVFPYGSVPLKTYLPDGDIDLTVISSPNFEDALVSEVHGVLRKEELNQDAPYEVKDVQYIDAEVKLVKCIVQNMVVDISFNQLGGLSTLCFLERVDEVVGKNHLFKRSIILIKAWCYYESRILGAHHGLISTYALETLILYIFHLLHHSLNGPLAVLYRFLDYFSKFDWDNYIISLNGPVCKTSLRAEPVGTSGELLFSDAFLSECAQMLTVPSRKVESFPQKHLNIIDPLKENNNLGRSVNRGNFYRIRSAFKYGARKLGQILALPKEKIADELIKFFTNTLVRHGNDHTSESQQSTLEYVTRISDNVSSSSSVSSTSDTCPEENIQQWHFGNGSLGVSCLGRSSFNFPGSKLLEVSEMVDNGVPSKEMVADFTSNDEFKSRLRIKPKDNGATIGNTVCWFSGDKSTAVPSTSSPMDNVAGKQLQTVDEGREIADNSENSHSSKSFLDLGGNFDIHLQSLEYVKYYHFYAVSSAVLPCSPRFPQSQLNNSPGSVCQSLQLQLHNYSQINVNGVFTQPYYMNHPVPYFSSEEKRARRGTGTYIPSPNMTYHSSNKEKSYSPRREKNHAPGSYGQWHRHAQDNGTNGHWHRHAQDSGVHGPLHRYVQENGNNGQLHRHAQDDRVVNSTAEHLHELSEVEYPYLGNGKPNSQPPHSSYPLMWGARSVKNASCPSENIDSESQGHKQEERLSPRRTTSYSATSSPELTAHNSEEVVEDEQERTEVELYNLREEDFPPLSH